MAKLFEQNIHSSSYIISLFTEPHLKEMLDEYAAKILICGRTVPYDKQNLYSSHREKVLRLYRIFFFGEPLSSLEREIERDYLAQKQLKFMRYLKHPNNALYRCRWT